ncbi:MAG: ABC transporter permease, partial [Verrucomicrobiota bacterium]|nr:ABC transporter permease [Verrucomicrobiota bacterium]
MLPVKYNAGNVVLRWRSTLATILGISMVVAVYVIVQALAVGLQTSSANTGDPRNLLIVRKGSQSESSSVVNLEQFRSLRYSEWIERDAQDQPMISTDVLTLVNLPRLNGQGEANTTVRGIGGQGRVLRPQVNLVEGRWFSKGKREVVVSQRLAARFENFGIGDQFKTGPDWLTVVGWFDGGNSAFDSEVWADADEVRSLFDRDSYSSLLIRPASGQGRAALVKQIEEDKRLQLLVKNEVDYYKEQTMTATPIKWMGNFLATAMSLGAILAAMNTMYATVGARTREIGTLRVLGFRRRTIVLGLLIEGILLCAIGGILGCLLSLPLNGYAT